MEKIITEAIKTKKLLSFTYSGLPRIVEPHIYGINDGAPQILGYQVRGRSSKGNVPDWRRFNVPGMHDLMILDETFPGRRPSYSGQHTRWDQQILMVE